jgi:ribA/ribD-fused uncharacterized protein
MKDRAELIDRFGRGEELDFFFFWGHTPKDPNIVDKACLSQWFLRAFTVDGVRYATAEHFMMAEKARLFRDREMCSNILGAKTPAEAKAFGRKVRNYENDAWGRARLAAVVRGNVAKFGQNEDLRSFLLSTGEKVIVEASPRDRIWGIGMGASNEAARDPKKWRGLNLLGFALMQTRASLRG